MPSVSERSLFTCALSLQRIGRAPIPSRRSPPKSPNQRRAWHPIANANCAHRAPNWARPRASLSYRATESLAASSRPSSTLNRRTSNNPLSPTESCASDEEYVWCAASRTQSQMHRGASPVNAYHTSKHQRDRIVRNRKTTANPENSWTERPEPGPSPAAGRPSPTFRAERPSFCATDPSLPTPAQTVATTRGRWRHGERTSSQDGWPAVDS